VLRLFGSYEALHGGMMNDALVDFTGGTSYHLDLRKKHKLPQDLFTELQTLDKMSTLMGCSITVSPALQCDFRFDLFIFFVLVSVSEILLNECV